jgi:hypothetical protein
MKTRRGREVTTSGGLEGGGKKLTVARRGLLERRHASRCGASRQRFRAVVGVAAGGLVVGSSSGGLVVGSSSGGRGGSTGVGGNFDVVVHLVAGACFSFNGFERGLLLRIGERAGWRGAKGQSTLRGKGKKTVK